MDSLMNPTPPTTEIVVCTTCSPANAPREEPRPGAQLLDALRRQAQSTTSPTTAVRLRGQACMSACSHACTIALQAAGKVTYLFGGLATDDQTAAEILACAQLHAASSDGDLPRQTRPERLRGAILARLPALGTTAQAPAADPP